ncbi:hypothetical protein Avbf_13745 [Armadillidium vulgare]|nr:hypothetical protein Avbf_13745 [Armadillidium vulgare]
MACVVSKEKVLHGLFLIIDISDILYPNVPETKMSDAKRKPSGSEFKKRRLNKQAQLQNSQMRCKTS